MYGFPMTQRALIHGTLVLYALDWRTLLVYCYSFMEFTGREGQKSWLKSTNCSIPDKRVRTKKSPPCGYKITIYLKNGMFKIGMRFHPSNEIIEVRSIASEKAYKTIDREKIDYIEVEPTARPAEKNLEDE
jgi:hypothetical protein